MQDCTEGTSADILVVRSLDEFDKIRILDRFDVAIVQDSSRAGEVELLGPPEITGGVLTKVENGQLTVDDKNRCKWVWELGKRLKITVYIRNLTQIKMEDNSSLVSTDTLHLKELFVDHRSSGDQLLTLDIDMLTFDHREGGAFTLHGKAASFVATIYETGKLDAQLFPSNYVYVFHYGLNRVDVNGLIDLVCKTENKGNTFYHSQPSGILKVYGRGPGTLIRAF